MGDSHPNPWSFSNDDENLFSPDKNFKVEYKSLNEIAMGSPLTGASYLIYNDKKIKLNEWSGGPCIWRREGDAVALPLWVENNNQQILMVNLVDLTVVTFRRRFRVLYFRNFFGNTLSGIDSPVYQPEKFIFNINNEKIEEILPLKIHGDGVILLK
ncbi:MAG: hypothetical protein ACK5ME_11100 [Parahaliea sp.]